MIDEVTIHYNNDCIGITLDVPIDDSAPYNLANAFKNVIVDTNVNAEMVLEELKFLLENE